MLLPTRVVHADWSANPRKRWMAEAALGDDLRYTAFAPKPVRDTGLLALSLVTMAAGGVLVGFDFPIGVPLAYARKVGISDFLTALMQFGEGEWADFYSVAREAGEISLYRPFYPASPGGRLRADLTSALGMVDLRRVCERRTETRRAAAELFWTIGAQQVGKAALSGWREILAPALKMPTYVPMAIWPFSGAFERLLRPGRIVVCEAYPGEFYGHLGVKFPPRAGGKRSQAARMANAARLIDFAAQAGIRLDDALLSGLQDGFGADAFGEDRFDCVVGLLGMLNVLLGRRAPGDPTDPDIAQIEGWILGMEG
jgi:hypothetical protein